MSPLINLTSSKCPVNYFLFGIPDIFPSVPTTRHTLPLIKTTSYSSHVKLNYYHFHVLNFHISTKLSLHHSHALSSSVCISSSSHVEVSAQAAAATASWSSGVWSVQWDPGRDVDTCSSVTVKDSKFTLNPSSSPRTYVVLAPAQCLFLNSAEISPLTSIHIPQPVDYVSMTQRQLHHVGGIAS